MKKNIIKIALIVIIDQIIKLIVLNTIKISDSSITIIPKILSLTYLENAGAAFGIYSEKIFLICIDVLIIFCLVKLMISKKYEFDERTKLGMTLILGGGIGNLIDRIFRGYVIDYIDLSNLFKFPIFNFSDICIVVGVIIIFILIIISTIKSQEQKYEKRT